MIKKNPQTFRKRLNELNWVTHNAKKKLSTNFEVIDDRQHVLAFLYMHYTH